MNDHDHRQDLLSKEVERLFDHVVAGEASEAELQAYSAWEALHPDIAKQFTVVRRVVTAQSDPFYSPEVVTQIASRARGNTRRGLRDAADMSADHSVQRGTYRERQRGNGGLGTQALRRSMWSAGALVVVMLAMFLLPAHRSDMSGMTRTYSTRADQQGMVTLDDGTQVTLSRNTTLQLVNFGGQTRTVVLDRGEAYFDVARSAQAPFIVQAGGATIRVLGTMFLVRNDPTELHTHVAVSEGRVRVNNRRRPDAFTTLGVGQVAEVADSNSQVTVGEALVPEAKWLHDRVLFRNTSVAVVLATLGRWYGYQFQCLDPALAKSSVTIVVSTKSSASALATLENVLDVSLTVVGETITLTPHPAQQTKGVVPRVRVYDVWTPTREVGR